MSHESEKLVWLRRTLLVSSIGLFLPGLGACGDDPATPAVEAEPGPASTDEGDGEGDGDDSETPSDEGDDSEAADDDSEKPPAVTPPKVDAGSPKPTPVDAGAKPTADAGSKPATTPDSGDDDGKSEADAGDAPPVASADDAHIVGPDPTAESTLGTKKGPFETGSYTSGYKDMPGFASGTIWYPKDEAAKPPYGCITVVPGFVSPESSIRTWGPFLASYGIVTFTIMTNSSSDQPGPRATALLDALQSCVAENERSGSPLMGKVDKDRLGIAGWSMGGGGTAIAASKTPTLKAAVSFAAWGPTGGGMNKVPVLMFEATADPLAAGMSDGYYGAVPDSTPKMLFEVSGAGHDVANNPANSSGIIGQYGLSWFKVFLEGDMRYRPFLLAAKPSITTTKFKTNLK
jgi:hypothetical protein